MAHYCEGDVMKRSVCKRCPLSVKEQAYSKNQRFAYRLICKPAGVAIDYVSVAGCKKYHAKYPHLFVCGDRG